MNVNLVSPHLWNHVHSTSNRIPYSALGYVSTDSKPIKTRLNLSHCFMTGNVACNKVWKFGPTLKASEILKFYCILYITWWKYKDQNNGHNLD